MTNLGFKAKIYIGATILTGIVLLAWNLFISPWWEQGWQILALGLLSAATLIFKITGTTERTHYNISFLVYAFTFFLLGTPAAMLVILISNLLEWAWHKYPWYIQSFNIACYLITIQFTGWVYQTLNPFHDNFSFYSILIQLTAVAVFTLINHLLIGIVLWLARGENMGKSGVFDFFPLMIDFTLLSMGIGAALVWQISPVAVLVTLTPVYLIYSTLRVPSLERKIEVDPKTGLFNSEYFQKELQAELLRAQRFQRPLTLVMADLDLLRNINNSYGHVAGDEVIVGIANLMQAWARPGVTVARFGGEEFAILMPEIDPREAFLDVEELRTRIQDFDFNVSTSVTPIKVTMSFGLSGMDENAPSSKDFIHNADTALYHSKLTGRNRSHIYTPEGYQEFLPSTSAEDAPSHKSAEMYAHPSPIISQETAPPPPPKKAATGTESKPFANNAQAQSQIHTVDLFVSTLVFLAVTLLILQHIHFIRLLGLPLNIAVGEWLGIFGFAAVVALTEYLSVEVYTREASISVSAVPILAGTLLFDAPGALIMSFTLAVVAMLKHRSPLNRFFFNWGNQLVSGLVYLSLVDLVGFSFSFAVPGVQFLVCIAAAIIVYFLTTFNVALAMHLDMRVPLRMLWIENFGWLAPYYLIMGIVAFGLTFTFQQSGVFGLAIFTVPIFLLRATQKQYVDRTRNMVNQLREKNSTLETTTKEITRLNNGLLDALAMVIDLRDPYVLGHSSQVTHYATTIARRIGLTPEQVENIRKASLLHDIGKLGVSESILSKPARLTEQEYLVVKNHPILGTEILAATHAMDNLIPIVRHHHEWYNGRGYPDGLAGNQIPLEARIVAVADAVESMASDRPYRRALDESSIRSELLKNSGTQFDPQIIQVFLQFLDEQTPFKLINSGDRRNLRSGILESTKRQPSIK